jgi:hypothetical protein
VPICLQKFLNFDFFYSSVLTAHRAGHRRFHRSRHSVRRITRSKTVKMTLMSSPFTAISSKFQKVLARSASATNDDKAEQWRSLPATAEIRQ